MDMWTNQIICCYYKLNQAAEDSEIFRKEQFQKEWAKLDARGEQQVNLTQHLGEVFSRGVPSWTLFLSKLAKRSGKSVGHDESYLSNEKTWKKP